MSEKNRVHVILFLAILGGVIILHATGSLAVACASVVAIDVLLFIGTTED